MLEFTNDRSQADGRSFYCFDCRRRKQQEARARRAAKSGRPYKPRGVREPVGSGLRRCPDCEKVLPLEDFVRNRTDPTGYGTYCRPCQNVRARESRQRVHGGSRHYHLTRRYGIGADDFDRMFREQRGKCAICGEEPAVHVDHDHETGGVRGLLCFGCNTGLGNFKDSLHRILAAADYLEGYAFFGPIQAAGGNEKDDKGAA